MFYKALQNCPWAKVSSPGVVSGFSGTFPPGLMWSVPWARPLRASRAPCSLRGLFPVWGRSWFPAVAKAQPRPRACGDPRSTLPAAPGSGDAQRADGWGLPCQQLPAQLEERPRACAPWGSLRCPELGREGGRGRLLTGVTPAQALYMDAVEYFPDEMQEVVDLMTEKELRVRLPLEELELLLED